MNYATLRNPTYVGHALYGPRQSVPWQPPRGHDGLPRWSYQQVPTPSEGHTSIAVPALVDEDLFVGVAERLEEKRKRERLALLCDPNSSALPMTVPEAEAPIADGLAHASPSTRLSSMCELT